MTLAPRQLPRAVVTVARTFGTRGALLRAAHELRRSAGRFRAAPRYAPGPTPPPVSHPFRVDPAGLCAATDLVAARARGDRVAGGAYEAFRWDWRSLPSDADAWNRHPDTGRDFHPGRAWWRVPHLDPQAGDIKVLWEPARFAWAYDLVRAYLVTGDDRYAAAFHAHFARWLAASPPFRGAHWSCGQETAIRAVALLYAEANLADAPSTTSEAAAALTATLAASGERIADALGYAVSQRNNHALSEAAGLVALGVRLRGQHPEAARWLGRGAAWMERLVREQFAEDGWYVQHSFTYLRLALDQCVVAERALRAAGRGLSAGARARLAAAARLVAVVIDESTGEMPNHGANDGAFVHPITLAPYRDFRPVLTAVGAMFGVSLPAPITADGEVLAWLGLDAPPVGPPLADGVYRGPSGWAAARVGAGVDRTAVFLRAGRYTARPGHLDPLHVDVRIGGRELVVDPGTFAYNAPAPWRNGLANAGVHNGPVLDGQEPGIRGPRFLWYAWPEADVVDATWDGRSATITAEIPGRIRRVVRVAAGCVRVEDAVLAADAQRVRVRWLLHPDADPTAARVTGGAAARRAAEDDVAGWFSPAYGRRLAGTYIDVDHSAGAEVRLAAEFGRAECPDP